MSDFQLNCPKCKGPMKDYRHVWHRQNEKKEPEYPYVICKDDTCKQIRLKDYVRGFWEGYSAAQRGW